MSLTVKTILRAGAMASALVVTVPAHAALLDFNFAGPSGTAVFQLDSNATPDFARTVIAGSDQFGYYNVAGTFGGINGTASTISFGTGIIATLNIVAPNLGFTQFSGSSSPLFSGTANNPTFNTGTFTLKNPFFGNGTLTVSKAAPAVPEPATWALLILGFGAIGATMRSRSDRKSTTVSYA